MRVLLLNQTFYPDVAATAQYLTDLAVGLAGRGHQVTVITSRRGYDCPTDRFPTIETWKGITIHRVEATGLGIQPLAPGHRLLELYRILRVPTAADSPP